MVTCKTSMPHEKPDWKGTLVRCNVTGYSCGWGMTHERCPPSKTPRDMANELR